MIFNHVHICIPQRLTFSVLLFQNRRRRDTAIPNFTFFISHFQNALDKPEMLCYNSSVNR